MADIEGTMVIRAWVEPSNDDQVRARLISSHPGQDGETVEIAGNAGEVLQVVQRWLDLMHPAVGTGSA